MAKIHHFTFIGFWYYDWRRSQEHKIKIQCQIYPAKKPRKTLRVFFNIARKWFNPFVTHALVLSSLKHRKTLQFSDVSEGREKDALGTNGLKYLAIWVKSVILETINQKFFLSIFFSFNLKGKFVRFGLVVLIKDFHCFRKLSYC